MSKKYIVAKQIKNGDKKGYWGLFKGNTKVTRFLFTTEDGAKHYRNTTMKKYKR